jgi:alpha-ketoglutarate-dependent 2,4-dichlorophenoxyacetate dioxygenase
MATKVLQILLTHSVRVGASFLVHSLEIITASATGKRRKMTISIRAADPARPDFVGEVEGIDLRQPATSQEIRAIEAGVDRFAILVFHNQRIDDAQQIAFSRNFGDLEQTSHSSRPLSARRIIRFAIRTVHINFKRRRQGPERGRGNRKRRLALEVEDISNLDSYGQVLLRADRLAILRNMLWHSDSSFKATPAKYSLLHARIVPPSGGNTEFADMRAAYEALDETTKAEIQNLVCEHCQMYSYGKLGITDLSEKKVAQSPPVQQRLVRRHPMTGRRSLFLSAHAGGIIGWPIPEARLLLHDLTEHATQLEFVHIHKWRPYDLVMWDNRVVMHRGRRYNVAEVRELHRTTVADIAPTLQQDV